MLVISIESWLKNGHLLSEMAGRRQWAARGDEGVYERR